MRNTSADDIILRTHAISMLFPGTIALDSVDYQVWRGMNVIIGENGAGKSTLMKILAGVQQPSSGEMSLNGNPGALCQHPGCCGTWNWYGASGVKPV